MLDRTSEKVLKCIISKCNGNPEQDILISDKDFLSPRISIELLNSICCDLLDQGYIRQFYYGYDNSPIDVVLTYKGYAYFEYKKIDKIEYIKQLALSKISDIILSFITAALTVANWNKIISFISALFKK